MSECEKHQINSFWAKIKVELLYMKKCFMLVLKKRITPVNPMYFKWKEAATIMYNKLWMGNIHVLKLLSIAAHEKAFKNEISS